MQYRECPSRFITSDPKKHYNLVIIGGGSGGISVAARFARYFRAMKNKATIAVIEPQHVSLPFFIVLIFIFI